jgi:hypothetical protein
MEKGKLPFLIAAIKSTTKKHSYEDNPHPAALITNCPEQQSFSITKR